VIVGGGLTGCAAAYAFAATGVDVVLVEADQVGRGSTGLASGWIGGDPGVSFVEVEMALGRAAARDAFRSWRRAALDFGALIRRLDIKCAFHRRRRDCRGDAGSGRGAEARQKARCDAGVDAPPLARAP
jgi:glycine/D-amino acid oxidase-like deaminating enzyme